MQTRAYRAAVELMEWVLAADLMIGYVHWTLDPGKGRKARVAGGDAC